MRLVELSRDDSYYYYSKTVDKFRLSVSQSLTVARSVPYRSGRKIPVVSFERRQCTPGTRTSLRTTCRRLSHSSLFFVRSKKKMKKVMFPAESVRFNEQVVPEYKTAGNPRKKIRIQNTVQYSICQAGRCDSVNRFWIRSRTETRRYVIGQSVSSPRLFTPFVTSSIALFLRFWRNFF